MDENGAMAVRSRLQAELEDMQDWLSPTGDNSESSGWQLAVYVLARRMDVALDEPRWATYTLERPPFNFPARP